MKKLSLILGAAAALCACSSDKATVSGEFSACPESTVYLEQIEGSQNIPVDSVVTNNLGRFSMKVSLPEGEATLYNLRCQERNIPLIVTAGEHVEISSVPALLDGYTVSGSHESELVKEIKNIMHFGCAKLDSMVTIYNQTTSKAIHERINSEYTSAFYDIKRKQIEFIIHNSGSLAAIYALNQRIPGDETLFSGENDIVYYRLVADSVEKNYPTSPYLRSLRKTIETYDQQSAFMDKLNDAIERGPAPFPELEMADMYGKVHSLSALKGNVVVLDFWGVGMEEAAFHNAELKEIFNRHHKDGLEIYQVAIDNSKPLWVEVVQRQKLPWISVCDFKGLGSPALSLYNIQRVPQNFIIGRNGDIVASNVFGDELEKIVARELKK